MEGITGRIAEVCRKQLAHWQTSSGLNLHKPGSIDVILDVGAHVGWFAIWARCVHPTAQILAFEPHPTNFASLAFNVRNWGITTIQEALTFHGHRAHRADNRNSSKHRFDSDESTMVAGAHACDCTATTSLQSIWEGHCLDKQRVFLKMDIEGAEWFLLADPASTECVRRCQGAYIECHPLPRHTRRDYVRWSRTFRPAFWVKRELHGRILSVTLHKKPVKPATAKGKGTA